MSRWRHNPGALRVRMADGETVALDDLAELLAEIAGAVEEVRGKRWGSDAWNTEAAVVIANLDHLRTLAVAAGVLEPGDGGR